MNFSLVAVQTRNEDGTIKLKVTDLNSYFEEIAEEIGRTYKNYSDIKIVCGDGSRFDANKSFLSRSPLLADYLQPNFHSSGESNNLDTFRFITSKDGICLFL